MAPGLVLRLDDPCKIAQLLFTVCRSTCLNTWSWGREGEGEVPLTDSPSASFSDCAGVQPAWGAVMA